MELEFIAQIELRIWNITMTIISSITECMYLLVVPSSDINTCTCIIYYRLICIYLLYLA